MGKNLETIAKDAEKNPFYKRVLHSMWKIPDYLLHHPVKVAFLTFAACIAKDAAEFYASGFSLNDIAENTQEIGKVAFECFKSFLHAGYYSSLAGTGTFIANQVLHTSGAYLTRVEKMQYREPLEQFVIQDTDIIPDSAAEEPEPQSYTRILNQAVKAPLIALRHAVGLYHIITAALTSSTERNINHYHKLVELYPDAMCWRYMLMKKYFKIGDFDEGIEQVKGMIGLTRGYRMSVMLQLLGGSGSDVELAANKVSIFLDPRSIELRIKTAMDLLIGGKFSKANEYFRSTLLFNHEHIKECNYLYALFLENFNKPEFSRKQWQNTIDLMLGDEEPEQQFKPIAESTNEALEYCSSRFLANSIVFKRGKDQDNIIEEYYTNKFAFSCLSRYAAEQHKDAGEFAALAASLVLVEHRGFAYHISKRKNLGTLEDFFGKPCKRKKQKLMLALDNTAKLHAIVTASLQKDDNGYYFVQDGYTVRLRDYDYFRQHQKHGARLDRNSMRHFYILESIYNDMCQTGSFLAKRDNKTSGWFAQRAIQLAIDLGRKRLARAFGKYTAHL